MQSIWLPFRQYSVSFRRWVGRPLRSAEANFIEAAERARQLADGSLLMLVNDPTRELMRVILEYVSWHQNILLPFAISPSLPNIVVDTTRAAAFAACRIYSPPNSLPIAARSIYCARGYDFNSAVLFNANTYCPSVPVYRSRLIGPVHSLVAGAADPGPARTAPPPLSRRKPPRAFPGEGRGGFFIFPNQTPNRVSAAARKNPDKSR